MFLGSSGDSLGYSANDSNLENKPAQNNPLDLIPKSLRNELLGTTAPALPTGLRQGLGKVLSDYVGDDLGASGDFKVLNRESLSFDDILGGLKSVAVLAINLFLIVIQVVVGILKALLPFLSK